jgi:hypothetical protein
MIATMALPDVRREWIGRRVRRLDDDEGDYGVIQDVSPGLLDLAWYDPDGGLLYIFTTPLSAVGDEFELLQK